MDANSSFQLSDAEWRVFAPVLVARGVDCEAAQARTTLDGMLWVMHTGASWSDLPRVYGDARQVNDTYRKWALNGLLDELLDALEPAPMAAAGSHSASEAAATALQPHAA
jgi:transposase